MKTIAIIGGGLAGKLTALYMSKAIPEARLVVIDPGKPGMPVVGESTVEVTVQFLKSLGLGSYLEDSHLHKYGLTYYFRLPESHDAQAAEYVQHEAPGVIRLPSYNLNRHSFDQELSRRTDTIAERICGRVTEVDCYDGVDSSLRLTVSHIDGPEQHLVADHVIDCSGRARVLAERFGLKKDAPYQRSAFWFRLKGFDRSILTGLSLSKLRHHCFDSYYVTHHFYGKGYWIWIIPMKDENGLDLASIGITYRADISAEKAMNLDRLCQIFARDHPKLAQLVHSGEVVDQSRYFNYMYEANQYYDRQARWFLVGDSGFTFDPANSAGIAYLGHQIPQVASIILKDAEQSLTPCYVDALERHLQSQLALQDQWSNWYQIMDDPVKMAWTLLLANMGYFHLVVPNYMTGRFLNAGVARQVAKLLPRYCKNAQPPVYPFPKLLDRLSDTQERDELIARIPALYERTIPFSYYRPDDIGCGRLIARYFWKRGAMRLTALSLLKWWRKPACWLFALGQMILATSDGMRAVILFCLPWLYEREASGRAEHRSAFSPQYAFLLPDDSGADAKQEIKGDHHVGGDVKHNTKRASA